MPLQSGLSNDAKSANISKLVHEGRPQDQAIAIAMDVARRSKRAEGGLSALRVSSLRKSKDELWDHYHGLLQRQISLPPERQAELAGKVKLAHRAWDVAPESKPKAEGGGVGMPKLDLKVPLARPHLHTGPIHSAVAGRTDHLPIHVPNKAYVLPADIVSGMGQGNTMAGFKIAKRLPRLFATSFYGTGKAGSGTPYGGSFYGQEKAGSGHPYGVPGAIPYGGVQPPKAAGGSTDKGQVDGDDGVPIVAAGGEHVYHPDEVEMIGGGDTDRGHDILDAFVKLYRAEHIKTLKALPGPRRD